MKSLHRHTHAALLAAVFTTLVFPAESLLLAQNTNGGTNSGFGSGTSNAIVSGSLNVFIGAGQNNSLFGTNAGIFTGSNNIISGIGRASFIGGGLDNTISGSSASFIGAGRFNFIDGRNGSNSISVIVAGTRNTNRAGRSVIVGGQDNTIGVDARSSTVTGGQNNLIEAINPSIAGGTLAATIGGGISNIVGSNAVGAVIAGGRVNTASGADAAVGGGFDNVASGSGATVPGGINNEASGTNSFAAGSRAIATHAYSFVWGGSPDVNTTSFGNGTFTVRAPGGVKFLTSVTDGVGVQLVPSGAGWDTLSDSNAKTGVTSIDHRQTLAKLAALPVTEWRYKHDTKRRYIGPMAQDFRAAFGLGYDDKHISTIDTDGVTMSAIKGLVEELQEQDSALDAREAQIRKLESAVQELREHLEENRL